MAGWLVAYDRVQGRLLSCYEQEEGETDDDFYDRACRLQSVWFRLRPSAVVEMRRAENFSELIEKNPRIFSNRADVSRAANTIRHQRQRSGWHRV